MPDWCDNIVDIIGDVNDIQILISHKLNFEELHPCPMFEDLEESEQHEKWREWMIDNWGTSWELNTDDVNIEYNNDQPTHVQFTFPTAWQPCCEFLLNLTTKMPSLVIKHKFYEAGNCIIGDYVYEKGEVHCNDIPNIKQFARDIFGYDDADTDN